jgi:hypothetical protein
MTADRLYRQQVTLLVTIDGSDGDPRLVGQGRLLPPAEWDWSELVGDEVQVIDFEPLEVIDDN